MTEDELQVLLERTLPLADLHGAIVEEIEDQDVRLRFPGGAGGGAQARLLAFIDAALRAAVLPATVVPANLNDVPEGRGEATSLWGGSFAGTKTLFMQKSGSSATPPSIQWRTRRRRSESHEGDRGPPGPVRSAAGR
jgi:hypothetical protein